MKWVWLILLMLEGCEAHAEEQKPEGFLRENGHISRDYRVGVTNRHDWMLRYRTLTPPPLDCKRHGPRKPVDDRCKE
jgi:hypothetical protein